MISSAARASGERFDLKISTFAAIATVLVTLLYLLSFWNRFVGLRSGAGEYGGGVAFLNGLIPYRDFFTAGPPFNMLKAALELDLFGRAYIVSRACGVVERLIIALVVFYWLNRLFRASHSAMAAIVTVILSSGDLTDPIASYNHDAILFGILCGYLASFVLDEYRSSRSIVIFSLLSGLCAGLSFSTKQTTGLGITASVPIIVCACLFRLNGVRRTGLFLLGFTLGWLAVASFLLAWLANVGALQAFIKDIFVSGPAAKASNSGDFITREILVLRINRKAGLFGFILIFLSWLVWRRQSVKQATTRLETIKPVITVLVLGIAAVCAAALYEPLTSGARFRTAILPFIYYTFGAVAIISFYFGVLWVIGKLTRYQAQLCLYVSVSFAVAFMLSLSFPLFELMMLPGLGLLIAGTLTILNPRKRLIVYIACCLLIASETIAKMTTPFAFTNLVEPRVDTANLPSALPQMNGFLLPRPTVEFVDKTIQIINANSSSRDTIFTYPELGFFYGIANRTCPTLTCSHNIDVVNDTFAKEEAKRLLANPPAVLIYKPQDESELTGDEIMWRNGRRSGNREIIAAVEKLAQTYSLKGDFAFPNDPKHIYVYVRPAPSRKTEANSNRY